jgi:uncharacterized protein with HEPN domain
MQPDPRVHVQDCLNMCEEIRTYSKGMTYNDFVTSILIQRACERCFDIIEEALNRFRKDSPEFTAKIGSFSELFGFHDKNLHNYDTVDSTVVWTAMTESIPRFQEILRILLLGDKTK